MGSSSTDIEPRIPALLPDIEHVYTDIHAHPELSMQETRTAGTPREIYEKAKQSGRIGELPTNHNPRFAPVLHPTLHTGIAALIVASRAWLAG